MTSPVQEGEILAGKYRVDRVLGVGGMGVVVAAHHIQLDDKVAIKFMLPQALSNRDAVARFAREARAAVKIKSEHIARVSDVGTLENGAPYMVMEYLEGSDLGDWLKQRGRLPIPQAVEFILQACEALAEAHVLGIVHRDLKPANLFIIRRPDGVLSVKVLDFGISKMTGLSASGGDMTSTATVMGSPLYMSPEQMRSSKDVDARSDIWALGVILYEALSGDSPFSAETMPELVLKIVSEPPPPLRSMRPDAPEGMERIILKCLDKDRGKRYSSVGELAVALQEFAPKSARGSLERISGVMHAAGMSANEPAPISSLPPAAQRTDAAASWGRTATLSASGKAAFGIGLAVLGLAAGGAWILSRRSGVPAAENTATAAVPGPPPAASSVPREPERTPPPPPLAETARTEAEPVTSTRVEPAAPQPSRGAVAARPAHPKAPPAAPVSRALPAAPEAPKPPVAAKPSNVNSLIDDRQ